MTEPTLLRKVKTLVGAGLKVKRDVSVGEIVLRETPYIVAPIDLNGLYARYLALSDDELEFLSGLHSNTFALSPRDELQLIKQVPKTSPFYPGFRWFYALMKCNAHGVGPGVPIWAIYAKAVKANHSCSPNVCYRNEDGVLTYVAIRSLKAGEEVTVTYGDCLFSSTQFRVGRLLKQKLFICECWRCRKEVDPLRRVWCPHCRTKEGANEDGPPKPAFATFVGPATGLKTLPQFQLTQKMNARQCNESDDWWMCTVCHMTYNSTVLPIAVEATLEGLYEQLDSTFAAPDPKTWMNYLTYLYRTTLMVLGPMHWLVGACHFLFSRFYAGVWNGGDHQMEYKDMAVDHGIKFIKFVEAVSPDADFSDLVPWSSVLMRLCLDSGDVRNFMQLTSMTFNKLRLLYGAQDTTIAAYESAAKLLHDVAHSNQRGVPLSQLQHLAATSQRPSVDYVKLRKAVPRRERLWLRPEKLVYDFPTLEAAATARSRKPWLTLRPAPPCFVQLAEKHLRSQDLKRNQQLAVNYTKATTLPTPSSTRTYTAPL